VTIGGVQIGTITDGQADAVVAALLDSLALGVSGSSPSLLPSPPPPQPQGPASLSASRDAGPDNGRHAGATAAPDGGNNPATSMAAGIGQPEQQRRRP